MNPPIPAILVVLLGLAACRTAREGHSSFDVLPPPRLPGPIPATKSKPAPGDSDIRIDYVAARARRPLSSPVYPPKAPAARAGALTAYVTLTINGSGRVVEAKPSSAQVGLPNDYKCGLFPGHRCSTRDAGIRSRPLYVPAKKAQRGGQVPASGSGPADHRSTIRFPAIRSCRIVCAPDRIDHARCGTYSSCTIRRNAARAHDHVQHA